MTGGIVTNLVRVMNVSMLIALAATIYYWIKAMQQREPHIRQSTITPDPAGTILLFLSSLTRKGNGGAGEISPYYKLKALAKNEIYRLLSNFRN